MGFAVKLQYNIYYADILTYFSKTAQWDFADMHSINRNVSLGRKFRIPSTYNFKTSSNEILLDCFYVLRITGIQKLLSAD